jgi:hypothetical protein
MKANRDWPPAETLPKWLHGIVLIATLGFAILVASPLFSAVRTQQTSTQKSGKAQPVPAAARSQFKVVASVQQLMTALTIPSSDVIFGAASDTPKTDAAWQTIQNNALVLAESGNLLMIPGRARDNQEWVKQSQAMIDAAMIAFSAAVAKNADKLGDAGDKIYGTCEACHNKYMPK